MRTVSVDASTRYDVMIADGLIKDTGKLITQIFSPGTAVIVSDDNVFPMYGPTVVRSLRALGLGVHRFVIPHGERSKALRVYGALLEFLCEQNITRDDVIIALGGGVVGDLAGFAAATYRRGIRFVQIPTTLLAAVDSSVGGKTAVNLRGGKNQVGSFYQPSLVICDTDTLKTLPETEYRCGCAEVIKYGVIGDARFFEHLGEVGVRDDLENVIERCVSMKSEVVGRDEFDRGERMLLNFGHTFGHAVEKCSGYTLPHGLAVASGMAFITRSAQAQGLCIEGTYEALISLLKKYQLPTEISYTADEIYEAVFSDKKTGRDKIRLVVPKRIGECVVTDVKHEAVREWLKAGGMQ